MGEGRHETHNHHRHCNRRRWPRSLWLDGSYAFPNSRAHRNPDPSADPDRHTYSGAIARPHTHTHT
jgi:hypothetical protein